MKKLLLVLLALVLSFTLVGCGDDADSEDVVLNWNIGADPRTLDPGLNGASDGGDVINNTFEGLVREKNGEVFPGMASDWTVSTDGLTVTFNMREDAKWSDGTALNADDFVRSWLRAMDPRNVSEYAWIWYYTNVEGAADFADSGSSDDAELDALKAAVGIQSLENGTKLEVKLLKPTDWFISLMAFYHFMPVPVNASSEGEGAWAKDPEDSISNGPFTLSEYTIGDSLVLVKNDNYWNADAVGIDVINGYFIDNATTAYAKYYAGELDFIPSVPTTEIPAFMISNPEFHVFPLLGTYYVNFNLSGCEDLGGTRDIGTRDNDIFCNQNLRTSLALALDRDQITEALAAGQVPAAGFIPPGFSDDAGEDFYDNSKDDSDIVTNDGAFVLAWTLFETAAGELGMTTAELQAELNTKEYAHNTSDGHQLVAELMQAMWSETLGFTIQITNEPWALFQVSRTEGDFDLARGGWLTDFMDPSGMIGIFTPGNAYNDPDYLNPEFVTYITAAAEATTSQAHFDALYSAHEVFMTDMPVIPVYHYNDSMLVKAYVEGWGRSVLGGVDFSGATIVTD
jgi:oligopeptide transport system substrate-binding protein